MLAKRLGLGLGSRLWLRLSLGLGLGLVLDFPFAVRFDARVTDTDRFTDMGRVGSRVKGTKGNNQHS